MDIAFADPTTPAQGTWVVLAKDDGALGPTGSELDRRSGGALRRAIAEWGGKLKRGEAIELLLSGRARARPLAGAEPGQARGDEPLDLETAGGSLAVKLRALRVSEASVAVEPVGRAQGDRAGAGGQPRDRRVPARLSLRQVPHRRRMRTRIRARWRNSPCIWPSPAAAKAAWPAAAAVIAGVSHGRDLVTEPANVLSPEAFAEACRELGSSARPGGRGAGPGRHAAARHERAARGWAGQRARIPRCRDALAGRRARRAAGGAGRQGRLLRHSGGISHQAGRRHGGDEVGHGRRRRRVRRDAGARRAQGQGERGGRARADREHAVRHRPAPGRRRSPRCPA